MEQLEEASAPVLPASRRILLIEDDQGVMQTLEYALRSAGYEVRATSHGKDIPRLLALLQPDLVITDVIMPQIDTLDAISALRRDHPGIKIIAISGNPHLLTVARKSGADHGLAKPFSINQLNLLVRTALQ